MATTTTLRLTYESYGDSSYNSYKFKLSNDDITIDFPHFYFSIGTDCDFTQFRYYDSDNVNSVNLETPESFLTKLVSEGTGKYGTEQFSVGITDDKIYIGSVTLKRSDELVTDIVNAFTDVRNKMWTMINQTALDQLTFYITSVKGKERMASYAKKYNDAFTKLNCSTFCSSEFKEAYSKAVTDYGQTITTI